MSQVMISYSRDNSDFANHLYQRLTALNIDTWIDTEDIPPGIPWRQAIFDALIASDYVVICLSPAYLASEVCRMECFLARSYSKRLLPVMVQDCFDLLPLQQETKGLEDLQYLSFDTLTSFGVPVTEGNYSGTYRAKCEKSG